MEEKINLYQQSLPNQCKNWYSLSKKDRRQKNWSSLYSFLLGRILPSVDQKQLITPQQIIYEQLQLLLISLSYHQAQKAALITINLLGDSLIILQGEITSSSEERNEQNIDDLVDHVSKMQARQFCAYLIGENKVVQKFLSDIIRQDIEGKQTFLSNYLFCGLTPIYPSTEVKMIQICDKKVIDHNQNQILIIVKGTVRRKNKKTKQSTELTSGSILNLREIAKIVNKKELFEQEHEDLLEAHNSCVLISFQISELERIVVLNSSLKDRLKDWLSAINMQRKVKIQKNNKINEKLKETPTEQQLTVSYPISFSRSRGKTAGSSFRCKTGAIDDPFLGDFVSIDRYSKMIISKEKVLLAQTSQCRQSEIKGYEKNYKSYFEKQLKIQTGKIHKRSEKNQIRNKKFSQISQSLKKVTHYFHVAKKVNLNRSYSEALSLRQSLNITSMKRQNKDSLFKPHREDDSKPGSKYQLPESSKIIPQTLKILPLDQIFKNQNHPNHLWQYEKDQKIAKISRQKLSKRQLKML